VVDVYRTFIAIELSRDLRARVTEHISVLRRELPEVRASWTREENLHLTLKFLGNVPVADISKLSLAIEAAARENHSFEFTVSGCGSFPPHGTPKVLWIGITDGLSQITRLCEAVERECERAGFPREARAFRPHLTIARLRSSSGAKEVARAHVARSFASSSVRVKEVCVMRSELSSKGSRYTALSLHRLAEAQQSPMR
jgi:2'-5' RNA ligase